MSTATPASGTRAATRAVTRRILRTYAPILAAFWLLMLVGVVWVSATVVSATVESAAERPSTAAFLREPTWWLSIALGVTAALASPTQYVTAGATRRATAGAVTRAIQLIALASTTLFAVFLLGERVVVGDRTVAAGGAIVGDLSEPVTLVTTILSAGASFLAAGASGYLAGTILYRWAPRWRTLAVLPALAPAAASVLWHPGVEPVASILYAVLIAALVVAATLLTHRILAGSNLREPRPTRTIRGVATS